jgi:hypothetical protein
MWRWSLLVRLSSVVGKNITVHDSIPFSIIYHRIVLFSTGVSRLGNVHERVVVDVLPLIELSEILVQSLSHIYEILSASVLLSSLYILHPTQKSHYNFQYYFFL